MRAGVLILEDHPVELEEAASAIEAEGFEPMRASSPTDALDLLADQQPVLAVIDWDMSKAPGDAKESSEVLQALAAKYPDTIVLVWAGGLGELSVRKGITSAHRLALTLDKRLGVDQLRLDIRSVLSRTFGDLKIEYGRVVHIPCGRSFSHSVALRLVANQGKPVRIERMTRAAPAAQRFQKWLTAHRSSVRIEARGFDSYRRLVETGEPPSSLPCPPVRSPRQSSAPH